MNDWIASGQYDETDGIWTSGMDQEVVDAIKAAGKEFVPIVGADRGGFVEQLLDEEGFAGPRGRGRHQHRRRRRRGRRAGPQAPGRGRRSRPIRRPPSPTPSSSSRSSRPTTTTTAGPRSSRGSSTASIPRGRSASRSTAGPRTPPSRRSPARARATEPDQARTHRGMPARRHPPVLPVARGPMTATITTTDLLLEATGVSKTYGAVVALKSASLAVRPGEVHALMGANGAGKSTLVKILTGAVQPDSGRIAVRGRERTAHSPAEARRGGLVSVYQEPALIPDLDIRSNLRLTETPLEPFRHWLAELGIGEPRPVEHGAARAAGLAPDHRPRPGPRDRARRAHARRDDRGPAREPHRAGPGDRRPPAGRRPLRHLHLPPDDRDRRRLRPGDRPARGRDRRRRRRDRGLRGADRRAHARRDRGRRLRRHRRAPRRVDAAAPTRRRAWRRAGWRTARSCTTSRSSSTRARCSAWSPSRARARTSCSTSWPARSARAAASCSWTARPSRSIIPPTPSAPASSTWRPIAPRRC